MSNSLAYYTNMNASVVIGQNNFTDTTGGVTQSKICGTVNNCVGNSLLRGIFVDPKGRFIVSDTSNNRVLIWNSVPTTNGKPADLVLGQPDFTSSTGNNGGRSASSLIGPRGVYSDGNRLFVFDRGNGRILIWNSFPTSNQQAANVVVGQASMTAAAASTCDAKTLSASGQEGFLWVHNGKLLAGSTAQRRILIWNSIPATDYASADIVLGQPDMNTCTAQTLSASSLNSPRQFMVDPSGKLFVADASDNRFLIWNSIPTTNNAPADVVIGQPDFTTNSSGTTANKFGGTGIFSTGERVFVTHTSAARALIFNSIPTSNGASADIVLGQPNFETGTVNYGGVSASSISSPNMLFVSNDKLFLTDPGNSRILIFDNVVNPPSLSLSPPSGSTEGKLKIDGSISVSEGIYNLWKLEASVNGGSYSGVSSFTPSTFYPGTSKEATATFSHIFAPWNWRGEQEGNGTQSDWSTNQSAMLKDRGYTIKFRGYNNNADIQEHVFYFTPFTLSLPSSSCHPDPAAAGEGSPTNVGISDTLRDASSSTTPQHDGKNCFPLLSTTPTISFLVNKYQRTELKDNLDHYEVWVRKQLSALSLQSSGGTTQPAVTPDQQYADWQKYITSIPIDYDLVKDNSDNIRKNDYISSPGSGNGTYENNNLLVSFSNSSSMITVRKKGTQDGTFPTTTPGGSTTGSGGASLPPGTYQLKLTAVDKANHTQDTEPILVTLKGSPNNKNNLAITTEWFPLQVNSIGGARTGILSTVNPTSIKPSYSISTTQPTLNGIAFSNTTITLTVTDSPSGNQRSYTTKAADSQWSLIPTLYPTSFLDLSAESTEGKYTELPTFTLTYAAEQPNVQGTADENQEVEPKVQAETVLPTPKPNPSPTPIANNDITHEKRCILFFCF